MPDGHRQELSDQPALRPADGAENLLIPTLAAKRGRFRLDLLRSLGAVPGVATGVVETLRLVNLEHRADTPVNQLAYGEKRRLEIGMCLATNPKVLLLDEPLAGMSPSERANTVRLLRRLRDGRTMVIVEHDMDALFAWPTTSPFSSRAVS